jgi:hypothetical protein
MNEPNVAPVQPLLPPTIQPDNLLKIHLLGPEGEHLESVWAVQTDSGITIDNLPVFAPLGYGDTVDIDADGCITQVLTRSYKCTYAVSLPPSDSTLAEESASAWTEALKAACEDYEHVHECLTRGVTLVVTEGIDDLMDLLDEAIGAMDAFQLACLRRAFGQTPLQIALTSSPDMPLGPWAEVLTAVAGAES